MNAQEIFDTVAKHLLTQNAVSASGERHSPSNAFECLYRGDNGLRCAVGCLIPDDVYDPVMEGSPAVELICNFPRLFHLREHSHMLSDLQDMHDEEDPRYWPKSLARLAAIWNVKYDYDTLANPSD